MRELDGELATDLCCKCQGSTSLNTSGLVFGLLVKSTVLFQGESKFNSMAAKVYETTISGSEGKSFTKI